MRSEPSATAGIGREEKLFDEFVAKHGDYDVLTDGAYRYLLDTFFLMLHPAIGERCIDLGCGTEAFTRRLRRFDLRLTGMDISRGAIAYAKSSEPQIDFLVGDIGATELPDGSQDIIVYSGALHHGQNG